MSAINIHPSSLLFSTIYTRRKNSFSRNKQSLHATPQFQTNFKTSNGKLRNLRKKLNRKKNILKTYETRSQQRAAWRQNMLDCWRPGSSNKKISCSLCSQYKMNFLKPDWKTKNWVGNCISFNYVCVLVRVVISLTFIYFCLVLELNRLRSLFVLKHQQLAEATARVELLSRELARSSQQNDLSKHEGNSQVRTHTLHI